MNADTFVLVFLLTGLLSYWIYSQILDSKKESYCIKLIQDIKNKECHLTNEILDYIQNLSPQAIDSGAGRGFGMIYTKERDMLSISMHNYSNPWANDKTSFNIRFKGKHVDLPNEHSCILFYLFRNKQMSPFVKSYHSYHPNNYILKELLILT